MCRGRVLFYH
ncbi:hypothetical protein Pint_30594 [Pistacia integerrima]|uniref:Uncharacterized protein n=1 Tax=Pistacia integerrima TaxID=434235 RepID=A0ACC0X023_9ROSI|nr:hypothetical protein Pint_30594 [Pistacia integerrima]